MDFFYPSILLSLFNDTIQYASTIVDISDRDKAIFKHSGKLLLIYKNFQRRKLSKFLETADFKMVTSTVTSAEVLDVTFILKGVSY